MAALSQLTDRTPLVAIPLEDDSGSGSGSQQQHPAGAGGPKIVVRTVTGRRGAGGGAASGSRDPAKPPKKLAVCRCGPLCRLLGIRRFPPRGCWLVMDVCGVFCAAFTWLLLAFAEYVVACVILPVAQSAVYSWLCGGLFHALLVLAFWSHYMAMFSDPGAVPLGDATEEHIRSLGYSDGRDRVVYKCAKCASIKPERSHHCSVCRRCVRKMDHHCPWINNCVGEYNQKYFVLFTLYICLVSFFAIYLVIHFFVMCSDWESCRPMLSQPLPVVLLVLLIFEGIMFGLFTAIMFGDQLHSILKDQTGIENLKRERHSWQRPPRMALLAGVFGQPFSWRWFSPWIPPAQGHRRDQHQRLCLYSV